MDTFPLKNRLANLGAADVEQGRLHDGYLVGKNGAGKSTMLKILCGLQKPTDGIVAIPNETTIGYLPQVMKLQDDTTVKEETRKAFAHNTEMKARLDKMQQEMLSIIFYHLFHFLFFQLDR